MTFLALLTKELRLTMRRERTVWLMITYVLLLGLVGWLTLHTMDINISTNWSNIGPILYTLLLIVQLLLVLFITPTFTATTINSEKERQTFDLLLCSRLSPLALIGGKLLSGLTNSLLLIAASLPLFSLVFFFGGVSPGEALIALTIFVITALLVATVGIFCSTLVARPAVSTALAYVLVLLWLGLPLLFAVLYPATAISTTASSTFHSTPARTVFTTQPIQNPPPANYLAWSPVIALLSSFNYTFNLQGTYRIFQSNLLAWQIYLVISILVAALFFGASLTLVKPGYWSNLRIFSNLRNFYKNRQSKSGPQQEIETKIPVEA